MIDVIDMAGASIALTHLEDERIRDGIAQRGNADPGQKTMLDTWHAAPESVLADDDAKVVAKSAPDGAKSTKLMVARMSRAERLQNRSIGLPDPGPVSTSMLTKDIIASVAELGCWERGFRHLSFRLIYNEDLRRANGRPESRTSSHLRNLAQDQRCRAEDVVVAQELARFDHRSLSFGQK